MSAGQVIDNTKGSTSVISNVHCEVFRFPSSAVMVMVWTVPTPLITVPAKGVWVRVGAGLQLSVTVTNTV